MKTSFHSIFYRLLFSYSLVATLPLTIACLVILFWGNTLVVRYVQTIGNSFVGQVAEELDKNVLFFTEIGNALIEDPVIQSALESAHQIRGQQHELDLYRRIFTAVQGHLSVAEVHISSRDGKLKFSTSDFPRRYDLANHQIRDFFIPRTGSPDPVLHLSPGTGADGHQILYSLTFPFSAGVLFLDISLWALETPMQTQTSSKLFVVSRSLFTGINLLQPRELANFSVYPELGIIFTDAYTQQSNTNQLLHRRDLDAADLSIIMISELTPYFDALRQILLLGLALVGGILVVTALISVKISRSISRPIANIIQAMTSDPQGPVLLALPGGVPVSPRNELEQLASQYNRMVQTILSLIQTVREEEQLLREAERRALQAQIQPHFLYNTLGVIKSLAKLGDFEAVSAVVTDLGKILRFTLSDTEATSPVADMTDLICRYLNIQKVRYQDRMQVILNLDPAAAVIPIPKLIIQPLVENAVVHGVERSSQPVTITVSTSFDGTILEIRVEDNGPGLDTDAGDHDGLGIGLDNVTKRLRLLYGEKASFSLVRKGDLTTALIRIEQ
jgi:two-component system sensor histidine kinase YesM